MSCDGHAQSVPLGILGKARFRAEKPHHVSPSILDWRDSRDIVLASSLSNFVCNSFDNKKALDSAAKLKAPEMKQVSAQRRLGKGIEGCLF
jgi:hypothetical protein